MDLCIVNYRSVYRGDNVEIMLKMIYKNVRIVAVLTMSLGLLALLGWGRVKYKLLLVSQ